jgi:hypothetical protein
MVRGIHISIAVAALTCLPGISSAEREIMQPPVSNMAPGAPAFPPNERCSTNSPCTNIAGEVLRIEESYWVRTANGREVHLKVTGDSNLKELPKVGDNIAAQLDSTGGVQALMKLPNLPKQPQAEVPSKTYEDLR